MTDAVTQKWTRTKADEIAVAQGCWFDLKAAERVKEFFARFLIHSTGKWAGQPFELLPWQWDVVAPLFGWKNEDGTRRFRRGYLSCGKKNGKTGLSAGLLLYLLGFDGEASAEVYSAASDRDQASLIYREAAKLVRASAQLQRVFTPLDSTKTITGKNQLRGCFYRALSADARRQEGRNASAILFDELHAQPGRELWDALRYSGSARRQPLVLSITTAGSDLESICGEQYLYSRRVISGEIEDPSFYGQIYEADPQDDWTKEATWKKANPSYGVTIDPESFRADFLEARETPAKEASFRRYRLNQWVQTADAWLSMEAWDACAADIDLDALAGRECYAGLDLSATDDTTALVMLFPDDDGGCTIVPRFYLPEANIDSLGRRHRVPYRAWSKSGHLILTPGNVVDYQIIREHLRELAQTYVIRQLAIDRKFQGQGLESDLINDGFDVVPAGQGWMSQDTPAKALERLIKSRQIRHPGHPVMRWHASNAVVDTDKAGNLSLNKKRARSKIDGIAALLQSLLLRERNPTTVSEPDSELILLDW